MKISYELTYAPRRRQATSRRSSHLAGQYWTPWSPAGRCCSAS